MNPIEGSALPSASSDHFRRSILLLELPTKVGAEYRTLVDSFVAVPVIHCNYQSSRKPFTGQRAPTLQ